MASNLQTNQSNSTEKAQAPGVVTPSAGTSTKTPTDVIESKKTEATGKIDRYNFLQDEPRFFVSIGVGDFIRLGPMTVAKTTTLGQIVLPIPAGITDANHIEYAAEALGDAGAAALATATAGREGADPKGAAALVAGIGAGATASAIGAAVSTILGGGNIQAAGEQVSGLTKNNFQVIMLKGPSYKKHEMNWKLAPKSQKESDDLLRMIKQLNNWSAPGIAFSGAYFTFPKVFNISFVGTDYLYKFKPCVCTDVSVNYTASGVPSFFKNGAPESVNLKLSFWELEYWLSGDF
tara:strand:- start:64 stop:939 length:876 start_codon:yes stop_codon:yes gene_type:complete